MGTWICKNCETENADDVIICTTCGAKKDAQSVDAHDQGVSSYTTRHNQQSGSQKQVNGNQFSNGEKDGSDNGDYLRELIKKYDSQKSTFKGLALGFVILQLVLFSLPYVKNAAEFTIYKNCTGINGSIEQICSILLVCITIAPAVVVFVNLNVRKRNLPITISVIVAILTSIYALVIWFGNDDSTIIPAAIILSAWMCVVFSVRLVKTMNELDNAMYRPKGF